MRIAWNRSTSAWVTGLLATGSALTQDVSERTNATKTRKHEED
jgi:hypothetical protein